MSGHHGSIELGQHGRLPHRGGGGNLNYHHTLLTVVGSSG